MNWLGRLAKQVMVIACTAQATDLSTHDSQTQIMALLHINYGSFGL